VEANNNSWVPNTGSSKACDTKYWLTVDLYCHLKMLLGKMFQDLDDAYDKILLQFDQVHLLIKEVLTRTPPPRN
jgi:hypothetical protein